MFNHAVNTLTHQSSTMQQQKYAVNQHHIATFLAFVRDGQIANYVLMQQEINIAIGAKSPNIYFEELRHQCNGGKMKYGAIDNIDELIDNLRTHCIPLEIFDFTVEEYDNFLIERRRLMANKIRSYYQSL